MTKKSAWRILAALVVAVNAAACSDGELGNSPSPDITPPAPIVITFAADPAAIKAGEATTIKWEVAGADSIQIAAVSSDGNSVNFNVQTEELSGSSPVAGLTADTDFTLTATKTATSVETTGEEEKALSLMSGQIQFGEEPADEPDASGGAPVPSVSSITQTITVKVLANNMRALINADKSPVAPGEKTVIRWEVTPADGATTVVSADSGIPIVATDQCDGDIATIETQPALDPMPAKGCAVVAPEAKTVYTVKGSNASGGLAEASATVDVESGDINAEIFVGKDASDQQKHYSVGSYPQTVTVQWKVDPAAAKVTVTATPPVQATTEAPCELPQEATDKVEASTVCAVSADTVFAISAAVGTKTDSDEAEVYSKASGSAALAIAEEWAFADEQVPIAISLDEGTKENSSAVEQLKVNGVAVSESELSSLKSGASITVSVLAKDVKDQVELIYGGGKSVTYEPVKVVELSADDLGENETAVSSVALLKGDNGFTRYRGMQMDGYNDGKGRVYVNDAAKSFDFGTAIKSAGNLEDLWNDSFFEKVASYPGIVAPGAKAEDLFVGVTGAVMRSQDGGAKWEPIMVSRRRAAAGITTPDHETCGRASGGGQNVIKGVEPKFEGDFISLNQICDIVVWGSRVLVATDFGVRVEEDINDGQYKWMGTPPEGSNGGSVGMLTFGKVANDLQLAGDRVFAVLSDGVVVSDDKGMTWKNTGGIPGGAFSLAYDERTKKVYAGAEGGIYEASADAEMVAWTQLSSTGPVTAIAIDPSSPEDAVKILIGTPEGVQVSRDGGASFKAVPVFADAASVRSIALQTMPSGNKVKYAIVIGGSTGARWNDTIKVSKVSSTSNDGDLKQMQFVGVNQIDN